MTAVSDNERRRVFSVWLRTGRLPVLRTVGGLEVKFNPWHDPEDGRFTFAGSGRSFSQSGKGKFKGGGGSTGGGGASSTERWGDDPPKRRQMSSTAVATANRESRASAAASPRAHVSRPLHREIRNGYEYQIDDTGRTRRVSGALTLADQQLRSRTAQAQAGGADRRPADDGGHYIASRFNGPKEAFNHFAQDANFNRGEYRLLEDQWARAKRAGRNVTAKIVPSYHAASKRPVMINIWFTINGHEESLQILNEPKEKRRGK